MGGQIRNRMILLHVLQFPVVWKTAWNTYPETCSAVISLPATNKTGGTITFKLINNSLGVVKSRTMRIEYKLSMNDYERLYIDADESSAIEAGKKKQIKVKFCGQGISSVNLDVSGIGISAKLSDIDWNAYPEECSATIVVSVSKDNFDDGKVIFQLWGDESNVIRSHCIQIKTFANPTESTEQNELKEYTLSSGYYNIVAAHSGKYLDVMGGGIQCPLLR